MSELSYFLKEILQANRSFHGGDRLCFLQIGLFSYIAETICLLKENHLWYKEEPLANVSLGELSQCLEGIIPSYDRFQDGDMLIFFQIGLVS
jgi:hypothetical protein